MGGGELQVSNRKLFQPQFAVSGLPHAILEALQQGSLPFQRQSGEDIGPAGKMAVRGIVRDPRRPGRLAQRETAHTFGSDQAKCGIEQRLAQIPMSSVEQLEPADFVKAQAVVMEKLFGQVKPGA